MNQLRTLKRSVLFLIFAFVGGLTSTAHADEHSHSVTLRNKTERAIATLEVAAANKTDWHNAFEQKKIWLPGNAAVVHVDNAGCVYDLRWKYSDGTVSVLHAVELCKTDEFTLH